MGFAGQLTLCVSSPQIGMALNLDLSSVTSVRCFNNPSVNYFNEFSTYLAFPPVTSVFVWLVFKNRVRKLRAELRYAEAVACSARS